MADAALIPPPRRAELIVRPLGDDGQHVVKDPATGQYFNVGEQEAFLLNQLDGTQTRDVICEAFRVRFNEPFTPADLDEFVGIASSQGFLRPPGTPAADAKPPKARRQSVLYWRKSLFDPDRLLNRLEPRLRFVWTLGFLLGSLAFIAAALVVFLANSATLIAYFPTSWEALLLAWVVIGTATTLHEFAHGLTCKHHGGEVHEIGFLMMFLMPCFYCDVSDAWLLKEKSKRLWVTFAGTYCDLCVWATAVFVWRVTLPGTLVNGIAMVVLTVCGARCFFNFLPLIKLDGYYFLSDLVEIPNLRQRSFDRWMEYVRWALWGAARPERVPRGGFLLAFGIVSWAFSAFFLFSMLVAFVRMFGARWGLAGVAGVGGLAWLTVPGMFAGFSRGEIMKMLQTRHLRTALWAGLGVGAFVVLFFVHIEDRTSGTFKVRPLTRAELRAPVSGFLQAVHFDEGGRVTSGSLVATIDIPDLASKHAQKKAEIAEAKAKLRLLEAGPRPEEVVEQRSKVKRAAGWRDLAEQDLRRKRDGHKEELARLDAFITQCEAELENARINVVESTKLYERKALALEQLRDVQKKAVVAEAQCVQAKAQKREKLAVGTQEAEAELARRAKELKDAEAALHLLEAGTRPEEIEAQRAHLHRLEAELAYVEQLQSRVRVVSGVAGVIVTPHLNEKVGQYLKEGDPICEIEDPGSLVVEIPMLEQDVTDVEPGQVVELRPRALPFQTFTGTVERVAPLAAKVEKTDTQSTITLYCRLNDTAEGLQSGMTGYARINRGQRPVGTVLLTRVLRYLRTEFWW
jgi:multidrug efflux pump subunit AcrA (membrane-fusion protein)